MMKWKKLMDGLTSARGWRRSWCCHRRLAPATLWSSVRSAPPGFPSLSPTPAVERGSGWEPERQVRKQKRGQNRTKQGEVREAYWNQLKSIYICVWTFHTNTKKIPPNCLSFALETPFSSAVKMKWLCWLQCCCIAHLLSLWGTSL